MLKFAFLLMLFAGSVFAEQGLPGNHWPQDLSCRQHDLNNGGIAFLTRQVDIRFSSPEVAMLTVKMGMNYYQPIGICYSTKSPATLVTSTDGTRFTISGPIVCLDSGAANNSCSAKQQNINMSFDMKAMTLTYDGRTYPCRWQDFWF
jgi:hypothetical protein